MSLNQNVGLSSHTFTGNNFGERSLGSSYLSLQYLLASSQDGVNPAEFPDGVMFSFSDSTATQLDWYSFGDGWDNLQLDSISLAGDRLSATLRVTNAQNQTLQTVVTVDSARLRMKTDSAGRPVVYVVGSFNDFNWTVASNGGGGGEGEGEALPADLVAAAMGGGAGNYADSVDACLAEDFA